MPLGLKPRTELFLILLLCAGGPLRGQTVEGSLRLQIEDGTGPVEGAAAEVVQKETNRRRTGVADRDGHLLIPLLPSGTYRLEVSRKPATGSIWRSSPCGSTSGWSSE